jgi:hypothetical protein
MNKKELKEEAKTMLIFALTLGAIAAAVLLLYLWSW